MRENPDLTISEILRIVVLDSLTIKLIFSETILRNQNYHQNLFTFDHHLQVESVEEVPPYNTTFIVRLSQALTTKYYLYVTSIGYYLRLCRIKSINR
jgi:hypothetical protein